MAVLGRVCSVSLEGQFEEQLSEFLVLRLRSS